MAIVKIDLNQLNVTREQVSPYIICWHRRAALAHSMEYKALKKAETQEIEAISHVLTIDGEPATAEEMERILNAKAAKVSRKAKMPTSKPFSLLK